MFVPVIPFHDHMILFSDSPLISLPSFLHDSLTMWFCIFLFLLYLVMFISHPSDIVPHSSATSEVSYFIYMILHPISYWLCTCSYHIYRWIYLDVVPHLSATSELSYLQIPLCSFCVSITTHGPWSTAQRNIGLVATLFDCSILLWSKAIKWSLSMMATVSLLLYHACIYICFKTDKFSPKDCSPKLQCCKSLSRVLLNALFKKFAPPCFAPSSCVLLSTIFLLAAVQHSLALQLSVLSTVLFYDISALSTPSTLSAFLCLCTFELHYTALWSSDPVPLHLVSQLQHLIIDCRSC